MGAYLDMLRMEREKIEEVITLWELINLCNLSLHESALG